MFDGELYSTIQAENDLTTILSKFDSEYIMDIINYTLNNQSIYGSSKPNAIYSLDMKYAEKCRILKDNPEAINAIKEDRFDLYMEVIDYICNYFNIEVDRINITQQNVYYIAYHIYNIFINYYHNTVKFFVDYIIKHKTDIYNSLGLNEYKKNKDSSTIYNKKLYKNSKLAIIVSNLEMVIDLIASLNISFEYYLYGIYSPYAENKVIIDMILSIISPTTEYFSIITSKILSDNTLNQNFISDVRIALSNTAELSPEVEISNFIQYENNEEA